MQGKQDKETIGIRNQTVVEKRKNNNVEKELSTHLFCVCLFAGNSLQLYNNVNAPKYVCYYQMVTVIETV